MNEVLYKSIIYSYKNKPQKGLFNIHYTTEINVENGLNYMWLGE